MDVLRWKALRTSGWSRQWEPGSLRLQGSKLGSYSSELGQPVSKVKFQVAFSRG